MRFDTTHEYYFSDPCVHYCESHDTLMIANHDESTDRIMIQGVTKDTINRLRLELNKEHLNDSIAEECANVTDKELVT